MPKGFYIAGIDGGGTKTECTIIDQDGGILGIGMGGPSNIHYSDISTILESYETAIKSALAGLDDIKPIAIGCTHRAASRPEVVNLITSLLDDEIRRYSEGEAALGCAGIFERYGIAQVAGTGSSTFGFSKDGKSVLVGGWGILLGDEGSAYDMAVRGLRAMVRSMDGRGPKTVLVDRACAHFGIAAERESILQFVNRAGRSRIASFAAEVTKAARESDAPAQEIVNIAISENTSAIITTAESLFLPDDSFPIVLHGGVMSEDTIADAITQNILAEYPNSDVRRPIYSPGVGLALFLLYEIKGNH
jgi:N-acetylglucosamine kinase